MSQYEFVSENPSEELSRLVSSFEELSGRSLAASDPEYVFIRWMAEAFARKNAHLNYCANQNLPSRARGENLDALGEAIFGVERQREAFAMATVKVTFSTAIPGIMYIPAGTRFSDSVNGFMWHTARETEVASQSRTTFLYLICETAGEEANDLPAGSINTLVDISNIPYFKSCENTYATYGGADEQTDEEYYETLRASLDRFTTAGSKAAYEYYAKNCPTLKQYIGDVIVLRPANVDRVYNYHGDGGTYPNVYAGSTLLVVPLPFRDGDKSSLEVARGDYELNVHYFLATDEETLFDVDGNGGDTLLVFVPNKIVNGSAANPLFNMLADGLPMEFRYKAPADGEVTVYVMGKDGSLLNRAMKQELLDYLSGDEVRPLTDKVVVKDPEYVSFGVNLTYYAYSDDTRGAAAIDDAVNEAVTEYIKWQRTKVGRDVNPDKLRELLLATGIKRAVITAPVFTAVSDGSDGSAPQYASWLGTKTVTFGGYENE